MLLMTGLDSLLKVKNSLRISYNLDENSLRISNFNGGKYNSLKRKNDKNGDYNVGEEGDILTIPHYLTFAFGKKK